MLDNKEVLDYKALKQRYPKISAVEKKRLDALERKIKKEKGSLDISMEDFVKNLISL